MYSISYPSGTLRKDGVIFAQDVSAPEYQTYEAWLMAGNGPTVIADEVSPRRIDVSAWQIRKALNLTGLRASVEAAVSGSGNQELKDGWEHSPRFFSDNELTLQMGAGLGKSAADMHALFQLAETL